MGYYVPAIKQFVGLADSNTCTPAIAARLGEIRYACISWPPTDARPGCLRNTNNHFRLYPLQYMGPSPCTGWFSAVLVMAGQRCDACFGVLQGPDLPATAWCFSMGSFFLLEPEFGWAFLPSQTWHGRLAPQLILKSGHDLFCMKWDSQS